MRLADYIERNTEAIVDAAQTFASIQLPDNVQLDAETLRDHLPQILAGVVADLRSAQSRDEEIRKSEGKNQPPLWPPSPAQWHGELRAQVGFSINHLVAEYRALRGSVLRLWSTMQPATPESFEDMMRFNQAIDQAVAESVSHYAVEEERWRQIFLGVLGHDLRGPLNAILLTSELMSKKTSDPSLSKHALRLIESGSRMNILLDTLLDYNRASLGMGIRIACAPTDLTAELMSEIEMLRLAWPEVQITFETAKPVRVNVDASRLREALANLVNNAVKYGELHGNVAVDLEQDGNDIIIRVHNNGATIPANVLATLFEPLHRGPQRASSGDGTSLGLGLFVVREVARAHGGDVHVTSEENSTTFTMHIKSDSMRV